MIEMNSKIIGGFCYFDNVEQMWQTVALQQAHAWEELDKVEHRDSPTRYETLESFNAWKYAREVAELASTNPSHVEI